MLSRLEVKRHQRLGQHVEVLAKDGAWVAVYYIAPGVGETICFPCTRGASEIRTVFVPASLPFNHGLNPDPRTLLGLPVDEVDDL